MNNGIVCLDLCQTRFITYWFQAVMKKFKQMTEKKKMTWKVVQLSFGFKKIYMKKLEGMEGEIKNLFKKVYLFISLKKNVWCFTRNISRLLLLLIVSLAIILCVAFCTLCHAQIMTSCGLTYWPAVQSGNDQESKSSRWPWVHLESMSS